MHKIMRSFTLAEVLITLTIIGVVAALTIPSLMQKTQNQEYVTALKKFYAQANQALAQTAIDEGTPGKLGASNSDQLLLDIVSHFKKSKDCGTDQGCWSAKTNQNYDGKGASDSFDNAVAYKFITADGMSVRMWINYKDCSYNNTTPNNNDESSPAYKFCGGIYVDVNGLKGPNAWGRDVFQFIITSNKSPMLYPAGVHDFYYWKTYNWCNNNNTYATVCAGRIMEEGWEMNY